MKRIFASLLALFVLCSTTLPTFAMQQVPVPVWEEYVPEKYQNPRSFPNKGKNIAELSVGILLTDLILTAPIGIPMIVHASTKLKNQGWYERKIIFERGLYEAQYIQNPAERKAYYDHLLKKCKMKEKNRQKYLKKKAKEAKKAQKA